jgi:hypothetical protein
MEAGQSETDQRLEKALAEQNLRDPREFLRDRLRLLKERDRAVFQRALDYYENVLQPNVSAPDSDPAFEWLEYGKLLAELSGSGRVVAIDPTGRDTATRRRGGAATNSPSLRSPAVLILHVPEDEAIPVLVLSAPRELSTPQQASFDLLVLRKHRL